MAINIIKRYSDFLELNHYSSSQKTASLKTIFDRDIGDNVNFKFKNKIIRPLKKEDVIDVESLFKHLTHRTDRTKDKKGKVIISRSIFDVERSKRLHWISPHLKGKITDEVKIFSSNNRIRGKNVIRTYIYNVTQDYVIILQPQRSKLDYYFITAYYLEKKYGGPKMINNKYKNKLEEVH